MKKAFLSLFLLSCLFTQIACETEEEVTKSTYVLKEENSSVTWVGYSPVLSHEGTFKVTSTEIEVVDGQVKGGTFTIPIASITNVDLPENLQPVLLEHLKSPDFFNLAIHPNAVFTITQVQALTTPGPGAVENANVTVTGNFTMVGQTQSVSFPAKVSVEGNALKIEAAFKIDRTKWGMTYAADPALGEHHIKPEVDIKLHLSGIKK